MTSNTPQVTVTEADYRTAQTYWAVLKGTTAAWNRLGQEERDNLAKRVARARPKTYEQGRADERAAIVAWHREWDEDAADFIAAGRHLTTKDAT